MATIAINDIKPTGVVFLTAGEAAFIDGGDGWWDTLTNLPGNVRGAVVGGIGTGTGAYVGSGGDPFKATVIGATGAINGFKNPVNDPWTGVQNFTTSFVGGVVTGYAGTHDHF